MLSEAGPQQKTQWTSQCELRLAQHLAHVVQAHGLEWLPGLGARPQPAAARVVLVQQVQQVQVLGQVQGDLHVQSVAYHKLPVNA